MNAEQFTQQVLGALQLDACAQAQTMLDEYVSATLPALHQELTRRHLETCADCRSVHGAMLALDSKLPALRSLSAPQDFTASVMSRTIHESSASRASKARTRSPEKLRAWLARPRFALESAYAMTVLAILFSSMTGVNAFDAEQIERLATQAATNGQNAMQQICLWERACPRLLEPPLLLQEVSEQVSQQVEQQGDRIESIYENYREKWLIEFHNTTHSMQSWIQEKYTAFTETITALTR
ncbi:MAG: zf-HC2 domain-containing protein [Gammaproteobacteria bacterium]|nr:zf-HC2 domain-containing protein [Gammaproteobacteria bacterium]MDP2140708.1 zf-HC2 domain-containing protein [Gammaproteobacteria bacterium]MDP2346964.1 zf-HC2 domain-containing protein [Gammaproteobacteria bacterium]